MKLQKIAVLLTAASVTLSSVGNAVACTAMMITDKQGNAYSGKTMEYSTAQPTSMQYFPAGTQVTSLRPSGKEGLSFKTKYPVLGVAAHIMPKSKLDTMIEAANDQGLSLSSNELISKTPYYADPDSANLMATDLATYLLGNFKTVSEVKQALQVGDVKVWLPKVPFTNNLEMPIHYVLFDKSGAGIVIEFTNGTQNIYDNPVGVAANAPEFPWHLKNLNNYAQLTNVDKNIGQFNKLKVMAPDSGNALSNLPSTQISAGRFIRAAFYTNYVRKANSPSEAVITLAHILNNFDRPYDLTIDVGSGFYGDGPSSGNKASSEVTLFTWMNDKVRNHYYLRTIDAMNFAKFEINKLASINKVVRVEMNQISDSQLDGTQLMLNASNR